MNVGGKGQSSGKKARRRRSAINRRRQSQVSQSNIIAALDLGSNNCRLLIACPEPNGFKVVDGFSQIVRLGEGVSLSGRLSEVAMDRATVALKMCAERIVNRGVRHGRYVATEACRRAENGEEFLAYIEKEVGLRLEIITSHEEAELTLTGCHTLFDLTTPYALTFDVGGGSAEFLWVKLRKGEKPKILDWVSLPCGVVTMTERYGNPHISSENYIKMVNDISALLQPFDEKHDISSAMANNQVQMLGTAGTVTTIAGVKMGLKRYNRSLVDGSWLSFDTVFSLCAKLAKASFEERAAYACIGKNRAELVVAGCGALEAICKIWPAGRLMVADRGVREGVLLGLSRLVVGQPNVVKNATGRHTEIRSKLFKSSKVFQDNAATSRR
jgi:exopolyphosphatase/guanosine-5'-triphosphate,3'-diphosphate pyrophosphatase